MTFSLQADRNEKGSRAENTYLQAGGAIMDDDPGGDGAECVKNTNTAEYWTLQLNELINMPDEKFDEFLDSLDWKNNRYLLKFATLINELRCK